MSKVSGRDSRYNGWTNYETWAVKLWIDNEQGSHEASRELAREHWEAATGAKPFTRSEEARYTLADRLKSDYDEARPEVAGVWADLLNAALSEVNWTEIANSLLESEDLEGYEYEI